VIILFLDLFFAVGVNGVFDEFLKELASVLKCSYLILDLGVYGIIYLCLFLKSGR